jgi:putative hydrolase
MKLLIDMHTHTVASSHAYSTLQENIAVAKEKGLTHYGVTDHGPMIPGGAHPYYFQNLRVIPREIQGIQILRGAEANIIDFSGNLDLNTAEFDFIDYFIASAHVPCLRRGTVAENTLALTEAMKNPRVSIIGHPDDGRCPVDYEILVKAAKKHQVLLEVNNSSLNPAGFRQNARQNVISMLKLCEEHQVMIIVNSDAHFSSYVGDFDYALEVIKEVGFPEELIINLIPEKFIKFIQSKTIQ